MKKNFINKIHFSFLPIIATTALGLLILVIFPLNKTAAAPGDPVLTIARSNNATAPAASSYVSSPGGQVKVTAGALNTIWLTTVGAAANKGVEFHTITPGGSHFNHGTYGQTTNGAGADVTGPFPNINGSSNGIDANWPAGVYTAYVVIDGKQSNNVKYTVLRATLTMAVSNDRTPPPASAYISSPSGQLKYTVGVQQTLWVKTINAPPNLEISFHTLTPSGNHFDHGSYGNFTDGSGNDTTGPFPDIDDMANVRGFPAGTLNGFYKAYVVVNGVKSNEVQYEMMDGTPPPATLDQPTLSIQQPLNNANLTDPLVGGLMPVTIKWSFADTDGGGTQENYRIELIDTERMDGATRCGDRSTYANDCEDLVVDFQHGATTEKSIPNKQNDWSIPSGASQRTIYLEPNRTYRWKLHLKSTTDEGDGSPRYARTNSHLYFTTSGGALPSTPTPTPVVPTPTPIVPTPTPLIDLEIDNADNPVGNPLIKDEGDPITIDWVGSALISCQAQRALPEPPEDSDRTNWWDSDTDGNNFSILNTNAVPGNVSGSRTFNTPTIATGGPLTRLLRYIIQCTPDGVTNIGDSEYVRVINIPIASFSANPSLVKSEQISQLTWRCDNSNYYTIDHGISTDAPCAGTCTGTYDVYPEDSTTYTLSCKNSQAGTDVVRIKQVTVQVGTIIEGH